MRTGQGVLLRFSDCRPSPFWWCSERPPSLSSVLLSCFLPTRSTGEIHGVVVSSNASNNTIPSAAFGVIAREAFGVQREAPRYPRQRERAREAEREQPPDYSRAPSATPRKDATVKIVVMGDANADWLAYGLEDAYSEKPEIGIVRKHRTDSGLISYDARRNTEWPQVAREIIAAERPKIHRHDDRQQRSSDDAREGSATRHRAARRRRTRRPRWLLRRARRCGRTPSSSPPRQ